MSKIIEVSLTSNRVANSKKWLNFSFRSPMSTQRFEPKLMFTKKQQNEIIGVFQIMEKLSGESSKHRKVENKKKLVRTNKKAEHQLKKYGKKLFQVLKMNQAKSVKRLKDLFGDEPIEILLNLDKTTRKFPWELCFDGKDFLCTKYSVGRAVVLKNYQNVERYSGSEPLTKDALVIGINYKGCDDELTTPEREALLVSRRLEKLGFTPKLLRGQEACFDEVTKILSDGVSIFHFSGHGCYMKNQPKGKKGRLKLFDRDLGEKQFRTCFRRAEGAPYFAFINSCQSANEVYDSHILDAFVDLGVENVIGNIWSVYDEPSKELAVTFYNYLLNGESFGDALSRARLNLAKVKSFEEVTTWAAPVLYGSPTNYL